MITLSKRLAMVSSMIPPCEVLADVGTDHGYLAAWVLQNARAQTVYASDIGDGPLSSAAETAERYDLQDRLKLFLADGLRYPGAERAEVITICGMGGETMISILSAAPWAKENRRLILQPQSKLFELEDWLKQEGYAIEDAKLCLDSGKCYLALSVLGGGTWSNSAENWLMLQHDPHMAEYVTREMQKTERALSGLRRADRNCEPMVQKLTARMEQLMQYEREVKAW